MKREAPSPWSEREREVDQKQRLWTELDRELVSAVRWITRVLRGDSLI